MELIEIWNMLPNVVLIAAAVFIVSVVIIAGSYNEHQRQLAIDEATMELKESYTRFQRLLNTIGSFSVSVFFVFGSILVFGCIGMFIRSLV